VRLGQVFANLISNSVKYMDPGGRIAVSVELDEDTVLVSISDTGYGLDPMALPRLFHMFEQSRQNAAGPRTGLGIGLALVKRLVEMHAGTVTAVSPGLGKGSTFSVCLPVARESSTFQSRAEASASAQGARAAPKRLLVVDDNVDAAVSLSMLLDGMGHEVRTAHDGDEAFDVAASFRPEMIFMDIAMPRMNGLEAAQRIRATPWGRDVVICAVTGFGQDEDRQRSHEAGLDLHLVKPVDASELERILARG
jgi:CheY-like chemotaxis protein